MHGRVEVILDNAPARSAELLANNRVDAALVPVIAYQSLPDVNLIPGVCVGARERVRSVALITRGRELRDVRSVSLDTSSRTSVVLTKIIFREFLGFEPEWRDAAPDLESMLATSDCALLIGDPALSIADGGSRIADFDLSGSAYRREREPGSEGASMSTKSASRDRQSAIRKFDLAQLWRQYTGLGFVFAMWMTRAESSPIDFAAARDEGLARIDEIVSNYLPDIKISAEEFREYLTSNISYRVDDELQRGMELYFDMAKRLGLCEHSRELRYASSIA